MELCTQQTAALDASLTHSLSCIYHLASTLCMVQVRPCRHQRSLAASQLTAHSTLSFLCPHQCNPDLCKLRALALQHTPNGGDLIAGVSSEEGSSAQQLPKHTSLLAVAIKLHTSLLPVPSCSLNCSKVRLSCRNTSLASRSLEWASRSRSAAPRCASV